LGLIIDLLALQLLTLAAFEIPAAVFDAYSRQVSSFTLHNHLPCSPLTFHSLPPEERFHRIDTSCTVFARTMPTSWSVLTVCSVYVLTFKNFTAMELADAARSSARRKAVYGDVSNRNPTLWVDMWQTIMLHLGESHRVLLTRNGRTIPAAIIQPAAPSAQPKAHAIQIKQDDIFRPAARAAAAAPPNKGVAYLQTVISLATSIGNSISSSLSPLARKAPVVVPKQVDDAVAKIQAAKPAVQSEVQHVREKLEQRLTAFNRAKGFIKSASGAEWAYREVDFVMPNRHVDQCLFKGETTVLEVANFSAYFIHHWVSNRGSVWTSSTDDPSHIGSSRPSSRRTGWIQGRDSSHHSSAFQRLAELAKKRRGGFDSGNEGERAA
jgi:hypothetical protein